MKKKLINILFCFFICFFCCNLSLCNENVNLNQQDVEEYDDEYDDSEFEDYEVETPRVDDKYEKINRKVYNFNQFFIDNIASPIGKGYKFIVPEKVRISISNFLNNIKEPLTFVNSILQFNFKNAGKSIAKMHYNLTVGFAGLFNPASKVEKVNSLEKDFGQTLAFYGVGSGPFFMVPFFGPYYIRDGVGTITDSFLNPFYNEDNNLLFNDKVISGDDSVIALITIDLLDKAATVDTLNDMMLKKSLDPYILMRDSYIKTRNSKIKEIKEN